MEHHVERIVADDKVLAIVVRNSFAKPGLNFITPEDFSFQLGVHISKAGINVKAHRHKPFKELKNVYPQEFFYVENGKVEIGIYNERDKHSSVLLGGGDMIILNCPHEVKFIEDSKFVELKQGPYRGKDAEKEYL
ncbi:hypothetical protein HYY70_02075 [Candidatus Woesearchaeota archaeon]|nr:hypothetical protein [Candidatus Woesearchaeota archaeon]